MRSSPKGESKKIYYWGSGRQWRDARHSQRCAPLQSPTCANGLKLLRCGRDYRQSWRSAMTGTACTNTGETHTFTPNSHAPATQVARQRLAARDRLARGVQDARVFGPRRSVVHSGTRVVLAGRDRSSPPSAVRAGGRHCGPGRPQGLVSAATATLQRRSVRQRRCWPLTSRPPLRVTPLFIALVPTTDDMLITVGVDSFSFPSGHTSRCVMLAALAAELSVPPVCSSATFFGLLPALQFTSKDSGVSVQIPSFPPSLCMSTAMPTSRSTLGLSGCGPSLSACRA